MDLGDFWWVPIVAAGVGAALAGYLRKPRNGNGGGARQTIHGSAIVDSSAIRELVAETRRQAAAIERMAAVVEAILQQMSATADAEAERARVAAAVAAEREKWERDRERRDRQQGD